MRRDGMVTEPHDAGRSSRTFIDNEKKVWTPVVQQVGLAVKK